VLLIVLQILYLVFGPFNRLNRVVTGLAIMLFILSSDLFPWDELAKKFPFLTIIQFPNRFLLPAFSLALLAVGITAETLLTEKADHPGTKRMSYAILGILVLFGFIFHIDSSYERMKVWQSSQVVTSLSNVQLTRKDPEELRHSVDTNQPLTKPLESLLKPSSDYVPGENKNRIYDPSFHPYAEYKKAIFENSLKKQLKKSVSKNGLTLQFQTKAEKVQLPI